jgi:hypothetical protein
MTNPLIIDGAQCFQGAALSMLPDLREAFANFPKGQAGVRVSNGANLRGAMAPTGQLGRLAAMLLGPNSRPVRAVLFDKTVETNWSLAWHQDRTICVKERVEVHGFGPWTVKSGMQHVAPPFELLTRMITVRAHLDDVPSSNAPLLFAPGSHTRGRVPVDRIDEVVRECGARACLAQAGDVWAYSTPILHASELATAPHHRRVLQVDFAAEDLPGTLEWLGI